MSQGKVNLPLYFLSLESSMFCKGPLLKEARAESKRGPCWPGNSLVEESEEVSHDHDDHAGKGDEDLLDLVHPLSWVLQFCNKRGFSGHLSSSQTHANNICEPTCEIFVAQTVKNLPAVRETWVQSLHWEDPLEEGMATHSSILTWRIPWTEESGRLQSMVLQRVRHHWATDTFTFTCEISPCGSGGGNFTWFKRWKYDPGIMIPWAWGGAQGGVHGLVRTIRVDPWDLAGENRERSSLLKPGRIAAGCSVGRRWFPGVMASQTWKGQTPTDVIWGLGPAGPRLFRYMSQYIPFYRLHHCKLSFCHLQAMSLDKHKQGPGFIKLFKKISCSTGPAQSRCSGNEHWINNHLLSCMLFKEPGDAWDLVSDPCFQVSPRDIDILSVKPESEAADLT